MMQTPMERLATENDEMRERVTEIDRVLHDLDEHLEGLELERGEWLGGHDREQFEDEDEPEFVALEEAIESLEVEIRNLRGERSYCVARIDQITAESRSMLTSWNELAQSEARP